MMSIQKKLRPTRRPNKRQKKMDSNQGKIMTKTTKNKWKRYNHLMMDKIMDAGTNQAPKTKSVEQPQEGNKNAEDRG